MDERPARDVIEELMRRQEAYDETALDGLPVAERAAAWRFIHIWRVASGMIVEHWACRDDMGLIEQLRSA
jgi:predicted ester cyclase